jgi:hypothetical protein
MLIMMELTSGVREPVGLDYSIWLACGLRSLLSDLLGRLPEQPELQEVTLRGARSLHAL